MREIPRRDAESEIVSSHRLTQFTIYKLTKPPKGWLGSVEHFSSVNSQLTDFWF